MENRRDTSLRYLRGAYTILEEVTASTNGSDSHVLYTITRILDSAGITESSLHNENIRPFITAIHTLFMKDSMKKRIESILRNPKLIILDSRIKIIYSGEYLMPPVTLTTQSDTTSGVEKTLTHR